MTRICITGGPRTGKTTLAGELGVRDYESRIGRVAPDVRHTDDLIGKLDWSAASAEAATWLDAPAPWIIEGVAVSRALRKWREQHPGERPPVDRVIFLRGARERTTAKQDAMAKGVLTVHLEIEPWLLQHGIATEYPVTAHQLRAPLMGGQT